MMKREYFIALYLILIFVIIYVLGFLLEKEMFWYNLNRFIIVWILISVYVGQYSMRFPKKF
jgi:hypothetical protein